MVEAVAASLKPKLEEFINSVEEIEAVEGWEWNDSMQRKIQNTRELLTFLNGDWKENLVTRNGYQSVEEVRRQEVALVGGEKVMKRIEMNLKRKITDPFFLMEQLKLSRFRIKFFWAFFPWQAQLYDVFGTRGFFPLEILVEERFGWWKCKGAGYIWHPEYAIVGKHFHRVVRMAFHMTDTEVNFDDLEDDEMDFGDSDDEMDYIGEGQDYYTRFDLLFVDREVEDEIHNLKVHSTTYADEHADCVGNSFGFLKEVVWALHKPGPPPLQELAAKVIHLHFPKATMKQELPIPLVQYLLSGPKPKYSQLSLRGQRIWNALVQEEEERLEASRAEQLKELEQMAQNLRGCQEGLEQEEIDWVEEREEEEEMQVQQQLEFEEGELDSKIDNCQYFHEMVALEAELEQEEIDQLEQRDREMERQLGLEQEELDRTVDYYQKFRELAGLEAELEQEEIDQLEKREKERENEIEMERQMELEQEDQDRRIDDYQNFHELAGLEVELEQEEVDQMEQKEKERENEIEMERQLEIEQEELDRTIDDYQNSHELYGWPG